MKYLLGILVGLGLSACATAPKTNSEFLASLPASVRSNVCTNQKYLSCMKLTEAQCLVTAERIGKECQKEAKTKIEKGSDQSGALGAFNGCVAAEHLTQTKQKSADVAMLCAIKLYRNP